MAIAARRACYCRECGTLHSTETGAILCFITDALRQKGDLASTNDNTTPPNILLDMHYHLSKAVKGPATDFDDANKSHQRTAAQLLQQLDDIYLIPVSWRIEALVKIQADTIETAVDLVTDMDLDTIESAEYKENSFNVYWDHIVEQKDNS